VLKGSGSVIAAPALTPWINASGNAALASAGTGDVLAGWLGGLWSQELAPLAAVCLGVHSHGAAADRWRAARRQAGALEASELIAQLRRLRAA
jgi:NAD(P)H-hydrate repair Nnr-like enzyme with NAD(P)H-hydrate dehydratase domain